MFVPTQVRYLPASFYELLPTAPHPNYIYPDLESFFTNPSKIEDGSLVE